jgi:glucose-6-phosphate isomerase
MNERENMALRLNRDYLRGFVSSKDMESLVPLVRRAHDDLENKTGAGASFTGWTDLPSKIEDSFLEELEALGREVRENSDCVVSIGIGGSYLGIRATIEYLRDGHQIPVYFAGLNMSADYHHHLLKLIGDQRVTLVVISKSGTTTEPALAFRIFKQFMAGRYSAEELKKRIVCVTDKAKGALRQIADQEGYRSFVIPDDVGGRFSVLTPVGLVPLAIAGVDIKSLVAGARIGQAKYSVMDINSNLAYQYAAGRFLLYRQGKTIEVFASFYDNMYYVAEFLKQLYGESEGKEGKGIFPASLMMSTDLHSMGQLMQEGERNVFETFLDIEAPAYRLEIPLDARDLDGFNCVAGKDLDWVNTQGYKATAEAHYEGGVPNMTIIMDRADPLNLGELYYFFERGVAISGYLLGINPFDQPGVEAYKTKMFKLLGK